MAVADASFNTVKDAISLGLTILRLFREPLIGSLETETPSIMISGSLFALKEDPPRILMTDPPPGSPLLMTFTPGTFPASNSCGDVIAPLLKSSLLTVEIDPVTFSPPLEDVRYMLAVTDSFGCSTTSSFDYESIHVKAEFTADPTEGEAPLEITFTDKSVRATSYTWKFGDDSISTSPDPGTHKYYIPGEYTVTLVIESELTCTDSATVTIEVVPSMLQIPNVFTPNEDGINDFFIPDKKSLKFLNLQIFAKSGQRVYFYQGDGDDLQSWQGWDGKINYSERRAQPGAYYYVLRAVGYDDVEYIGREYRGTVYLFR